MQVELVVLHERERKCFMIFVASNYKMIQNILFAPFWYEISRLNG